MPALPRWTNAKRHLIQNTLVFIAYVLVLYLKMQNTSNNAEDIYHWPLAQD